uniref:C2H2-type domain-containing protein n=1 Tax=Branchiostoma floridae TaxID=7739 RepID=C3Y1P7_BRAFL|eukprot:XP_002609777.1 hypothetical protein BRAFLDRAFT_78609 [Branchiostoma floridae]
MSDYDSNPFADPEAGNPFQKYPTQLFQDPSVTQVTGAAQQNFTEEFNPFAEQGRTTAAGGKTNPVVPPPQKPQPAQQPAVMRPTEEPPAYSPSAAQVESWLQATYKRGKNVKLSEEEIPTGCEEDVELIDWKQLLCLLCRRRFNCKGELLRHQQFSNLHQSNLEVKRRALEEELKDLEMELEPSSSSSIFPNA